MYKLIMGGIIAIGGYAFYKHEMFSLEKVEYIIENDKIPEDFNDFKIVQISDLHNGIFGKNNINLIELVDSMNPDVIFMTGDLVDGERKNFKVALDLIDELSKKYKIYHIIGNHEQKSLVKRYRNLYKNYFKELYNKNIINLEDDCVKIIKNNSYINLYGLTIPLECYTYLFDKSNTKNIKINKDFIKNRLGMTNEGEYNILLSHTPFYFKEYSEWGADLVLSGHVHGGIIRVPLIGGLLSPNREFFPEYDLGEYKKDNSTMILSKGLGGSRIIIRLNCKPEVVGITLKSIKKIV